MSAQPCVLIVDSSPDSREVLRTALARSGTEILEAARAEQGLKMVQARKPDVIVLDLDDQSQPPGTLSKTFGDAARTGHASILLLGTAKRQVPRGPAGEFVAKPYHYGPVIRRIESLLARSA